MIDRKKGPKITTEFDLSVNRVEQSILSNGIELIEINDGTQDIIKVEIVFNTGRIHEQDRATAKAAIGLIREGSTRHGPAELAHIYDFYGAVVKTSCAMEFASISLVVVERHFQKVWPIWLHMIFYPQYLDQEVKKYSDVSSQKLTEQLSKNDVQSYRALTEIIFGDNHPYGYNTEPQNVSQLSRTAILDFYNTNLGTEDSFVIVSGKYSDETRKIITRDTGQLHRISNRKKPSFYNKAPSPGRKQVATANEIQTSIKMGRSLFPIKHPDYGKVKLLDMIFGGYFGSRLMKNIREEKGYTYGIYSSVHCWKNGGFLYISADVDNKYIEPTIAEIKSEMEKLRSSEIPAKELSLVKSYILGQSLHLLDGPFAKGALVKNLKVKGRKLKDFEKSISTLKELTASQLKEVAQQYLNPEDYTIVLAGKEI